MKLIVENPNDLVVERYYTEKDMLKIAGGFNKQTQQKYELEPGDIIYFDKENKCLVLATNDDDRYFDFKRFSAVGTVVAVSRRDNSVKLVTPYFSMISVDFDNKPTDKQIMKLMKNNLDIRTAEIKKSIGSDIKFYLPDENDFNLISKYPIEVLNGLETISHFSPKNCGELDKLLVSDIFGYISDDKKELKLLLGGIGPDFTVDYMMRDYNDFETFPDEYDAGWTPYSKIDYSEFMNRQQSPSEIVQLSDESCGSGNKKKKKEHDSYNLVYSFKSLKKAFPRLQLLDFYSIAFAVVKIDY